ncbi:MAG TPA: tetratricopeptide repeat protein [Polyangiaceae bacterium]|jgi:tetratricopeptide (TPR) repeat protein|nr:tetratricopeptide repeat protein [Polyangiaceae bacterium]
MTRFDPPRARTSRGAAFAAAAVALVLGAAPALAVEDPDVLFPTCDRKPTQADIDAAMTSHKAGAQLYERNEFDRAIENWRDTYRLDCSVHAVLINVAAAYEKKGDKESAIAALEAYLRRYPKAPDEQAITERIETLKRELPPKVEPTATPLPSVTVTAPPPPPPPLPRPERPYGIKPWYPVVIGGVATLAGVILLPLGLSAIGDAEEACGEARACPMGMADLASKGNTGRTQVIIGDIALGVGLAGVAGGLIWQMVLNKPRLLKPRAPHASPAPKTRVAPALAPGFGGLSVAGAF